jgi:hypothetical protein
MSITFSLVLDKTFCCEQVHQCGKMPASSQVLLDIHRTMLNLLDFEPDTQMNMNPIERELNLLNEVPTSRTCEDAGIGLVCTVN